MQNSNFIFRYCPVNGSSSRLIEVSDIVRMTWFIFDFTLMVSNAFATKKPQRNSHNISPLVHMLKQQSPVEGMTGRRIRIAQHKAIESRLFRKRQKDNVA